MHSPSEKLSENLRSACNLLRTVKSLLRENVHINNCVGEPLTAMQMKVLKSVIDGKSNKEIADLLGRSTRTIEVHRAHMMEKLGVSSLLDLVKRAVSLGLIDLTRQQEPDIGSVSLRTQPTLAS